MKTFLLRASLAVAVSIVATAGMAQAGCIDVNSVPDEDLRRNAALIASDKKLCANLVHVPENGMSWRFLTIEKKGKRKKGPTIFLLHDNEQEAFDTALYAIMKYGGRMVSVEAEESRQFIGQDPNRNFADTAAAAAPCREMRVKPAPKFTKELMDLHVSSKDFIITLHNNANGHSGNGGGGAISAARKSQVMLGLMAPNGGDEDDAILLAGTVPFEANDDARALTNHFHGIGVNVIYEHVRPDKNDCSFSNYVVLNKQKYGYFNVEAQHGHLPQQKAMLDALMAHLGYKPL